MNDQEAYELYPEDNWVYDKEEMKENGFIYLKDEENHPGRKGFWVK